jgi:hypothetical protein
LAQSGRNSWRTSLGSSDRTRACIQLLRCGAQLQRGVKPRCAEATE